MTAVNLHMGDYRVRRATDLLNERGNDITLDDLKRIQCDTVSYQAKDIMEVFVIKCHFISSTNF